MWRAQKKKVSEKRGIMSFSETFFSVHTLSFSALRKMNVSDDKKILQTNS
jgi:hypothetical protein